MPRCDRPAPVLTSLTYRVRKVGHRYRVERFIGYTDGKPSWSRLPQSYLTRMGAVLRIGELRTKYLEVLDAQM